MTDPLDLFASRETPALADLVTERLARHFAEPRLPRSPDELARRFVDSRVPAGPMSVEDYVTYLFDEVVAQSVRTHDQRFVGHMTSALPSFVPQLGRILTALNQNVVKVETSDAFTFYERQSLAMLHRLFYSAGASFYDTHAQNAESTLGMMVSGGTLANVAGLWCARNRRLGPKGGFAGVRLEGMSEALRAYGYRRAVIVGSSLLHYSFDKAVDLLGLGRSALLRVPATERGSADPREIAETLARCAAEGDLVLGLVGIAGTTETGAIDPLGAMADLAEAHGCHFHVDAAWGGPVIFSERHRGRLAGIERADSIAIDGHKQLYLPMGIGSVLFRAPEAAGSIETTASYIIREGSWDLGRRTLEGSRPAMAMFLHAALHLIGARGYERLIDEGIERAAFFAREIAKRPELELLAEPELNIVVYRYVPRKLRASLHAGTLDASAQATLDEVNRRLQGEQRDDGASFVSRTTLRNTRHAMPVVSLRAVLANPLTTRDDLLAVLAEQITLGDGLTAP
jgi:putative pyridoxal-dependent aspartate 1-decarboxylase